MEELKGHVFFTGTDWDHIRDRPAAIPVNVKHMADTSNFDDFEELDEQKRCEWFNGVLLLEQCALFRVLSIALVISVTILYSIQ